MKITVLSDNNSSGELGSEWGLSFWIESGGKKILLDTGASSLFHENAQKLGIRIEEADLAIMSHAHYDHCGGLPVFFKVNPGAPVFIRAGSEENCWDLKKGKIRYIGIPRGVMSQYRERIVYVSEAREVMPGAWIVPHLKAPAVPNPALLIWDGNDFLPDTFTHEQSLVMDSPNGLTVFSSCSHTGPRNIAADISRVLPGKTIRTFIGGLHIYSKTPEQVKTLADEMLAAGIEKVYTGHCTGAAFEYLKENLGERAEQFYAGMVIEA